MKKKNPLIPALFFSVQTEAPSLYSLKYLSSTGSKRLFRCVFGPASVPCPSPLGRGASLLAQILMKINQALLACPDCSAHGLVKIHN